MARPSLRAIAAVVDRMTNPKRLPGERREWGFMVAVWKADVPDKARFVHTCRDEDLVLVMKMMTAQLKGQISEEGRAD